MPATPDRDTLILRAPDRRTPAELVALARRELARRPAATLADAGQRRADRALAMFRANYPAAFERGHAGVWWAVAHGHGRVRVRPARCPDGWCLARAYARRYGLPAPPVDQLGRLALGDPGPSCQAALGWRPPKPTPKPTPPRAAARSSTPARSSTRGVRRVLLAAGRPAAALDPAAGITPTQAAENAAACRRLGMDPARWPHLTRATTATRTRGRP